MDWGRTQFMPGNAVPISATPPMLALCELRPVSSATRVGEQTGAVCMLL